MRKTILCVLLCWVLCSCADKIDYEAARRFIINSELAWGPSLAAGDSSVTNRIVADDFIGINSKGEKYDKKMVQHKTLLESNWYNAEVYNVEVVFYGNTAVARGKETWTRLSDSTSTYSVWTDTWIYRNGKWQLVAAQDQKINLKK